MGWQQAVGRASGCFRFTTSMVAANSEGGEGQKTRDRQGTGQGWTREGNKEERECSGSGVGETGEMVEII